MRVVENITGGDPDKIEEASDMLEKYIKQASKDLLNYMIASSEAFTKKLVTDNDGTQKYIPVSNASIFISNEEKENAEANIKEIMMETVYLSFMMNNVKEEEPDA